jgi:hypothetical protein
MAIDTALRDFYQRHGFGEVPGERPGTVAVYTGCLLVPLPNIETRRKFLKYHDIHHLVTGYSVGRIGEGEISAWELGTGSAFVSLMLGVMNLIALSTGLVLEPRRMWRAYNRGCLSHNLYRAGSRADIDAGKWADLDRLRGDILEIKGALPAAPIRAIMFSMYSALALIIHASLAIPAVIARFLTDTIGGASFFEAVKPKKRTDLY